MATRSPSLANAAPILAAAVTPVARPADRRYKMRPHGARPGVLLAHALSDPPSPRPGVLRRLPLPRPTGPAADRSRRAPAGRSILQPSERALRLACRRLP